MRRWQYAVYFLPVIVLAAASAEPVELKANLDLPAEAMGEREDSDTIEFICFCNQTFEGGGFFFCLDRSGSTANGELAMEKRETIRVIQELGENTLFAVVFYDAGMQKFPAGSEPAQAIPSKKAAAIAFIAAIQPGHGSCPAGGLIECLRYADRSPADRNQIILLTDGETTCPGADPAVYARRTLADVTARNHRRHPINTVYTGVEGNEAFPKALAAMNGGTYSWVTR